MIKSLLLDAWQNLVPATVMSLVGFAFVCFVAFYVFPAFWFWFFRFRPVIQLIRDKKKRAELDHGVLNEDIGKNRTLKHLWSEYKETLHTQKDGRIRSTVSAENFFNTQVLVDIPLHTEFFRHLPGILTGIGIIGTFWGLIEGLNGFQPGGEPEAVRASLQALLNGVRVAFVASGIAIFVAMLITLFEKILLAGCYRAVGDLVQAIDALYDSGVGEEYLSQLVYSSEQNATQTTQLKDSLVGELKQLLTNLTERQIQASQIYYQESSHKIANQIQESIHTSMLPLGQIASAVDGVRQDQSHAVHGVLENILAAFTAKLEDTFGGSMKGLNTMMTESVHAMQNMQQGFQHLITDLKSAGSDNTNTMGNQLLQVMSQSEVRQNQMNQQMMQLVEAMGKVSDGNTSAIGTRFREMMENIENQQKQMGSQMQEWVTQIRSTANQSQSAMTEQLSMSITHLSEQMGGIMSDFTQQRKSVLDDEKEHQAQTHETNQQVVSSLQDGLKGLIQQNSEIIVAIKENTQSITQVTVDAVSRMNQGAENLFIAASEFQQAGESVQGVMTTANEVYGKLNATGMTMEQSARTLQNILQDYTQARSTITQMVAVLKELIENAKNEAGMNHQIVSDMQKVSSKLSEVQQQTNDYLNQISKVLTTSFNSFGDSVEKSLSKSKAEFDSSLSNAVQMLSTAIDELSGVADDISGIGNKLKH
ncbi:anti-phage ZorAB system protein ZorA [Deltaproteobacteria bacterium TL4]